MVKAIRSRAVLSWSFSFLLFGFVFFSAGTSYSFDIHEINAAIQASGGKWFAKETPLSHLSLEQMRNWAGGLEPSPPYPDLPVGDYSYPPAPLSSSFDWMNHNGKNYVTGIRNQGSCGSCWAFATTAALESKNLITFDMPNQDLDLSEQIVLSCTGGQNNCNGGYMEDAANFIKNSGTAGESCYPYTQTKGRCGQACSSWQNDPYKIDSWSLVYPWQSPDISTLKNAISSSGPVVVWMQVYQDFQSYGEGVYSYSWGSAVGGHFVLVVGWDDSKGANGALKVKNSWGPNWGENGYFWIAYSEFGNYSKSQFAKGAMALGNAVHSGPPPAQKSNLIPYQPDGWSDKIVVSNGEGTNADSNLLSPTDTLYVDFAVDNDSDAPINSKFYVTLYVDGVFENSWSWNSLDAHHYDYVEDYSIGSLSVGNHTIRIVVDSTGAIDETNEGDNEYTKTITIKGSPSRPDLSVEYASFTRSCSRSSCKVSGIVEIDNVGNRDAPSTYTDIYLYDAESDDFTLLKRSSTSLIKKGGYKTLRVSASLPRGENGSGKYIAVFADADDILAEPDEDNNILFVGPFD